MGWGGGIYMICVCGDGEEGRRGGGVGVCMGAGCMDVCVGCRGVYVWVCECMYGYVSMWRW